jgi:putative DNA methylase
MPPNRKKLIEVSIPLEAINKASAHEKMPGIGPHPRGVHIYWARRPLAACRAVLFAQLVDDPSSWPDRFPTEEAQDTERRRLHKIIEDMVPWEASNDETILNAARWEIARSFAWGLGEEPPPKGDGKAILDFLQTKAPPVYDPFSGGGSIPLEAQRLGLRAYGSDLNPVAVLIGKALVEIPPKFAGLPPVNPKSRAEIARGGRWNGKGAQGLAEDVRHYGQWMRDEAEKRIGHLYPKATLADESEATVIAWLWARTVRSPDPAAKGAMVPLVSSFMLSTKEGKKAWVEVVIDPAEPDGWRFEVAFAGDLSEVQTELRACGTRARSRVSNASEGARYKHWKPTKGSNFVCAISGASITAKHIKSEGMAGHLSARLMAIVAEGDRGRVYLAPKSSHEQLAASVEPGDTAALAVDMPENPRWFSPPGYGMRQFGDLFTPRQLVALTTFSDLVGEAREKALADATAAGLPPAARLADGGIGAEAYADAVATYLAFACDRCADFGNSATRWSASNEKVMNLFARQAIPMVWDFPEANSLANVVGGFKPAIEFTADCLELSPASSLGYVSLVDAAKNGFSVSPVAISTDPPYYDNIGYADLSDFFYVWLRRSLSGVWPDLFRRLTTPKAEELVATPYRHGSKDAAEAFFMQGMSEALTAMRKAATDAEPLAIYYAFKQSEVAQDGITSAGWASFLQAIVEAGLAIDGTWPNRSEQSERLIGKGSNALASSIVLVCRKRGTDASVITRADFVRLLRKELPDAIDAIRKAGVGPVDMQQSVIGPGMGVFSRHAKVLEDDDSAMPVKTALSLINRVWEEIDQELDANFDPETQVALAWFATYGFEPKPAGDLIGMATAKDIPTGALFASGVFKDLKGKTALTPREELPKGWTPATDKTLTVWECVQHTARVLSAEDGGGAAAGRLVAEMGSKAADARTLAYRLFEIATQKGWASEALIYNELAQEWPKLEDLISASSAPAKPVQADMFGEL